MAKKKASTTRVKVSSHMRPVKVGKGRKGRAMTRISGYTRHVPKKYKT